MIDLDSMSDDDKLAALESIHKSIAESKEVQKQKIAANVDLVLQALKKMESDIRARYDETGKAIEKRVASIKDGKDGRNGVDGKAGRDGRSGADGATGPRGADGLNGRDGRDGEDGVSVTDAHIDFDGSLIIHLSTGRVINVGEVVAPDLVERIKVITNGGGTSQQVLDTLVSLQNQINAITTGVTYQGTWNASTNTPTLTSSAGTTNGFYIVSVAGSTTLNGTSNWGVGDWAIFNGSIWQRVEGGSSGNFVDLSASGTVTLSGLTASTALALDASKNIVSVTNTGTGNNVLATSPTLVTPVLGAPTSGDFSTGTFTWPTFNQNTTGTASNVTGTVAIANGGTGETTRQAAMDALAGAVTSGSYLRGNGTDVVMNTIQAADVPTLNQNTTGTASNVTGTVAIANGGTGATTAASALSNLGAVAKAGDTMTGALGFVAGSASTPSLFATGDTNTGIFFPAADTIAFAEGGAEAMRIDSDGDVGIGTTTPAKKLDILSNTSQDGIRISGSANPRLTIIDTTTPVQFDALCTDTEVVLRTDTNHPLVLSTNGTERMRLDTSGNLGLGVTPSAWYTGYVASQFGVNGSVWANRTTSDTNIVGIGSNQYLNSGATNRLYISNGFASRYEQSSGVHSWFTAASGTAGNAITFTQAMTLDASGNLGIGTTSPTQKITANGSIRLTGNSGNFNETGAQMDSYDGLRLASYISTGSAIQFLTNASGGNTAERARIDSSGNLLVGTTSQIAVTSSRVNILNVNEGLSGLTIGNSSGSGNTNCILFNNSNGIVGTIRTNGSATAYNTSSDYRLKNTIAPMTGALAKVALLKPCTYKWNVDGTDGEGFIAHELAEVVPDCVSGAKDAIDENGNPVHQGIDTSFLVATLTSAIQEQQALITTLTQRITALEAK